MSGNWNRAGRKSGGYKPSKITVFVKSSKPLPDLSIQCFEKRHKECSGDCHPFGYGKCECECHPNPSKTQ